MSGTPELQLDRWGRPLSGSWMAGAFRTLYSRWFRVEWEQLENLPSEAGGLLVANHAGMVPLDGGFVQIGVEEAVGRPVYMLAHDGFWRFPLLSTLLSRTGAVVGHPENAQRLLAEDRAFVLVFPEGAKGPVKPPRERYRLQRFGRGGFVETAMRAGVPVVPIVIMGTEDATPTVTTFRLLGQDVPVTLNALLLGPLLGSLAQLPAKVRMRVLPPVHFDQPTGLERYPRSLLMDEAERIRSLMQENLDAMLRRRSSVWAG